MHFLRVILAIAMLLPAAAGAEALNPIGPGFSETEVNLFEFTNWTESEHFTCEGGSFKSSEQGVIYEGSQPEHCGEIRKEWSLPYDFDHSQVRTLVNYDESNQLADYEMRSQTFLLYRRAEGPEKLVRVLERGEQWLQIQEPDARMDATGRSGEIIWRIDYRPPVAPIISQARDVPAEFVGTLQSAARPALLTCPPQSGLTMDGIGRVDIDERHSVAANAR